MGTMNKFDANLWLWVKAAPDVPGQWVAHCLDLDLVTQGDSPEHALRMLQDAVALTVFDDLRSGHDPAARPKAPKEDWDEMFDMLKHGQKVPFGHIPEKVVALAVCARFFMHHRVLRGDDLSMEKRPPAWMIDQVGRSPEHLNS